MSDPRDPRDLVTPPDGPGGGTGVGGNFAPGGGVELSRYDTTNTNLKVSDDFHSNNSDVFQSSNLDQPSSNTESWRNLSQNMEPSQGSGSGQINQQQQNQNDAQWIRAFSLIVYSNTTTGGGSSAVPVPARININPPRSRGNVIPFRHRHQGIPVPRDDPAVSSTDSGGNAPSSSSGSGGQQPALDISALRCSFTIQKTTLQTPNQMYARVYNLAPETLAKVIAFTRVQVYAGYRYASYGIVFDGEVVQYRRGKENPVDTYLEIHAFDGDTVNNATVMFKTYPAGTKERQVIDDYNNKKKELDPNFKVDQIQDNLYQDKTQRDMVVVGHSRNTERRIMLASGAQHFLDNGAFIAITNDHYRDGEVVVLSPSTGLVGLPEVTPQGIQAKCLLNPKLKLGGLVQIDSKLLSGVAYTPGSQSKVDASGNVVGGETGGKVQNSNMLKQQLETAFTSPIGQYKILMMTYTGDTRGNPWYCDITCVAMDSDGKAIVKNNTSNVWVRRASVQATRGTTAK